jgi:hypothetical protein
MSKGMMADAKVAMMSWALLKRGVGYFDTLTTETPPVGPTTEYDSIRQMPGSMSRNAVPRPAAFDGTNYIEGAQLLRPGGEEEVTGYSVRGTTPPQMFARVTTRATGSLLSA